MSAAERRLRRALEECASAVAAGVGGASRRAAVREAWRRHARTVPARVARAATREALASEPQGEAGRRDAVRVERTARAVLRNACARFALGEGLETHGVHQATEGAEQWAVVWANASVASARRRSGTAEVAARLATTAHEAHVRLGEAARLEGLDAKQWRRIRAAAPWMLRAALEGPGPGTASPWTWVRDASVRAARRHGGEGHIASVGATRDAAGQWPCRTAPPPLVAVWAHACESRGIEGAQRWDGAMQCETQGCAGEGARALVERCARSATRYEERVRHSLRRWWALYASDPQLSTDTTGMERRWEESGPARAAPAPTRLVEHEGALAWEASLDGMWAVLCAARGAPVQDVCAHRSIRIGRLHAREWAHRSGWGARATRGQTREAVRTTGVFLEWMRRTGWKR